MRSYSYYVKGSRLASSRHQVWQVTQALQHFPVHYRAVMKQASVEVVQVSLVHCWGYSWCDPTAA
jgi:hypothetical protein